MNEPTDIPDAIAELLQLELRETQLFEKLVDIRERRLKLLQALRLADILLSKLKGPTP